MLSLTELDALRQTEPLRENLVDIQTVHVDPALSAIQRAEQYLRQIRNPYCFLCGDSVVRVRFAQDGGELKDRLKNYFISCKQA